MTKSHTWILAKQQYQPHKFQQVGIRCHNKQLSSSNSVDNCSKCDNTNMENALFALWANFNVKFTRNMDISYPGVFTSNQKPMCIWMMKKNSSRMKPLPTPLNAFKTSLFQIVTLMTKSPSISIMWMWSKQKLSAIEGSVCTHILVIFT